MPQPVRNTQSQILTFSDFSKGIVQRIGTLGAVANSPAQLGAASITNTYRCISLPGGGLGPLPKNTSTLSFTDLSTSNLPGGTTAALTGFHIFGPMYKPSTSAIFPNITSTTPFELHLGYEYISGGSQIQVWRKYPYYSGDNSLVVATKTSTSTGIYGPMYFTTSTMNHAFPTSFGYPVIVGSWNQVRDPSETHDYSYIYPDPTDGTTIATDTPYDFGALFGTVGPVLSHQSRVLMLRRGGLVHGGNGGVSPTNERVEWTGTNDYSLVTSSNPAQFGLESPYGYGTWGSLTSSDLLLIKHSGGAYLLQGDINNPIVRRFPAVMGTNGVEVLGAETPLGFIYGVKSDGVYAWQGGDASVNLSPQLEDGFWQATTSTYRLAGSFLSWGDVILCPNNFVLDVRTQAFWRIEDISSKVYYQWQVDPYTNIVYGLKPTFTDVSGGFAGAFNSGSPALNFSWQSQPFGLLERRRALLREVFLTAQGAGTITITFTSDEGSGSIISNPNVATLSTSGPTRVRLPMQAFGQEFVMRIVSDGASAAPIVYSVELDVVESTNVTAS